MDDRLFHRRNSGFQRRAPPESGQRLSRSGMCEEELCGRDVQRFETPVDVIEFGPQIITHLWGKLVDEEDRSEEHTSELQSLMRPSSAAFFLKTQIEILDTIPKT